MDWHATWRRFELDWRLVDMPTFDLTVLDDSALSQLMGNPNAVAIIPALNIAAAQLKTLAGCGRCQAALSQKRTEILNTLKINIRMLSGQPLLRLKQVLNTKKIRVRTREGQKMVDWTL